MPEFNPILIDVADHIATVTLNRPHKGNALTAAMWRELGDRMRELAAQSTEVRVVILRGAGGKVFSAGADLSEFTIGDYDASKEYGEVFEAALHAVMHHPAPVIAQLHGQALGGGCQLALACDLRVAATRAELGIPIARIGLGLPAEAYLRLVDIVGPQQARQILYLGRRYSAQAAYSMGLVDWVMRHERLESKTYALAQEIAVNAPLAVQAAKAGINAALDQRGWNRERDAEELAPLDDMARRCFNSKDVQEGIAAFFGHRKPEFTGE